MELEDLKELKRLLKMYLPVDGSLKVVWVIEAVEEDIERLAEK